MPTDQPDKTIDDGGPAFPFFKPANSAAGGGRYIPGMSIRMWLAGMNHAAMLGNSSVTPNPMIRTDWVTRAAFRHADALIAESNE